MLQSLSIKNYAIIKELDIKFKKGLNIITGETGAGKSIIIGALNLILGKRADTKVLFTPDEKCIVEGVIDISDYGLKSFFKENDLDYEDELIIRREINTSGKSRAFINDTPSKLATLSELGNSIIDLHQQFATLEIHRPSFQLKVIDQIANNATTLDKYAKNYKLYKTEVDELDRITNADHNSKKEADYLKFQLAELLKADLKIGEKEKLQSDLIQLTHAEDIQKVCSESSFLITDGDDTLIDKLRGIYRSVASLQKANKSFEKTAERIDGIITELEDISAELSSGSNNLIYNPEQIIELQDRIDMINSLESKHNLQDESSLLQLQTSIEEKLSGIENIDKRIEDLKESIKTRGEALHKIADKLSAARAKAAPKVEKYVNKLLNDLSMPHAELSIDQKAGVDLGINGSDKITFMFSSNKGSKAQSLKDVASGGELARLNLSIKSLIADKMKLPSLVFDEIDTGISGAVALKMGIVLSDLSKNHQIISITHSPQVASRADEHLYVYKETEGKNTVTKVRSLPAKERITELAKMLSGDPPSKSAISNAKELIEA